MRTSNPSTGTISRGYRFAPAALALALLLVLGFAPSSFAQADPPSLTFGNNFFVTGDYVVAGAYNMNSNSTTINGITYTTGTINVPDMKPGGKTGNPGIQGVTSVPTGAEIVDALLYWQTAEMSTAVPGGPGTGQNGFFRPVITNGAPSPGYPLSGVQLTMGHNAVSWSQGGCSTAQTGKVVQTYRADVTAYLPQDANGNVTPNSEYQVMLPSVGNQTPLTLGATLVIIYRVLSPNIPLNSIVIYEGPFGQTTTSLNMTQTVQGFAEAGLPNPNLNHAVGPIAKLTHIVGHGLSNKFQTVYLNGQALPSLYGNESAFPGYYAGSSGYGWDNPTWAFPEPKTGLNPVTNGLLGSISTEVVPTNSNPGCVSWGAEIFSTTVPNDDLDGLPNPWKLNQGYCDASINEGKCTKGNQSTGWVDLPGAVLGSSQMPPTVHPDLYVQYDYMCTFQAGACSTGTPLYCSILNPDGSCNTPVYSLDPDLAIDTNDKKTAVQKVIDAYAANTGNTHHAPITLHVTEGNAIDVNDPTVTCTDNGAMPPVCSFPNQPGLVAWPGGLVFLKNQLVDYNNNGNAEACALNSPPATCAPRFQHGKKDSYHYVLFGQTLGLTNWALQDGSLATEAGCPKVGGVLVPCVVQSGKTVTFTTSTPNGIVADAVCPYGRVTVAYANTNPNLNGTFCVTPGMGNTFIIQVPNPTNAVYPPFTYQTDPSLAVAPSLAGTVSGFSYVGGGDSLITLGSWGALGATWNAVAGTFMHELGHANGLTHGGLFYDKLAGNPNDYTPTFEANCKPNVQSVMSYLFQVDLLDLGGIGNRSNVLDYSAQALNPLNETSSGAFSGSHLYPNTSWYSPAPQGQGTAAHCDGSPSPTINPPKMVLNADQSVTSLSWLAGQDINFDGILEASLRGHTEWTGTSTVPGLDLRQVGATGNLTVGGGGKFPGGGSGGGKFPGGGSGGGKFPGGGSGGASELNVVTATSVPREVRNLTVSEAATPRTITFTWISPTSGAITQYNIYESLPGGGFSATPLTTVSGIPGASPGTFYTTTIAVTCNPSGYSFKVTAVSVAGTPPELQESAGVIVSAVSVGSDGPLTACYNVSSFSSTASAVQATQVQVQWTLTDDFNTKNNPVTRPGANTLVAIGPGLISNGCTPGRTTLLADGNPTNGLDTFTNVVNNNVTNQFTFTWNNTDAFCAGSYTFELDLDHVPANPSPVPAQVQLDPTPLQLAIDVNDTNSSPHVATVALSAGTVGQAYSYTLSEDGGTAPFKWTFTGSLPPGISPQPLYSPTLSGTTCVAGSYNFTAMVSDSRSITGTQPLTLPINKANTTTSVMSSANPSVFQQMVTFTVTVAPQYACTPTGTVNLSDNGTQIATSTLNGSGTATFTFTPSTLSVGNHNITANYSGDGNFLTSTSTSLTQTVNKANTSTTNPLVSPSPAVVGQAITVAYTFAVLSPGAGTPIGPSGTITVLASDGSGCSVAAVPGPLMCTLSPAPTTAGKMTLTVTYSGDNNFVGSGGSGSYTVLIFVSDAVPPPFTAVTTLPNGVVGSPYSNTVYESGGVNDGTTPFTWTIVPGSLKFNGSPAPDGSLGISFPQQNAVNVLNGTLSGTATAPGTYTFTAQVTDSAGNTGTQTETLNVLDAAFGDLIVVDGTSTANPLAGTVFRITPSGTSGTIAAIANGSPTGVAVDATTGNIYVAVDAVGGSGTSRIVKVDPFGVVTDFITSTSLANPVAVAVDGSGNVYVGDNTTNAIYEFSSSGAPVGASPFAQLPSSNGTPNHIRMAFDSSGNLDVASDGITGGAGPASGPVEVDQINTSGTVNPLYNTTTQQSQATQILTVGGIAVLPDGSIDVADYGAQTIYKITNPGGGNMFITTAFNPLCCNISGITNPSPGTTLFVTLNQAAQVVQGVPPSTVTTILTGTPLTFPNDVAWYSKH